MKIKLFGALAFLLSVINLTAVAQCDQNKKTDGIEQISAFFSDPELSKFKMQTMNFGLAPGEQDTVAHRHDCDLFIVVLEGTVEIGQEFKKPVRLYSGQVFHEKRNVIHSLARNPDPVNPVKILLLFVIKEGRQSYTKLYP